MNRSILFVPLAFVVGGIVGYWSPCRDLRTLEERRAARTEPARKTTGFNVLNTLVKLPENPPAPAVRTEPAATNVVAVATESVEASPVDAPAADRQQRKPRRNFSESLEEAAELWKTRSEMARVTAIENLGLDAAHAALFDEALKRMNRRLKESFEALAENLQDKDKMDMELGVRMLGDVSAVLAEAYDAIGEAADPSKRAAVSELSLLDFIDPAVAQPLEAVSDRL